MTAAPRFPTGGGRRDTRKASGAPYATIEAGDIWRMAGDPPSVPKDAPWFIPSTYIGADARSFEAQREHGTYWLLVADLDKGDHALEDVVAATAAVVGVGCSFLVYSTRSAKPGERRWRILVPLAKPIAGRDYEATQRAF